jgi:phosphoribosylformylglycinamidine synthase
VIDEKRTTLQKQWGRVSYEISRQRENPNTAGEEYRRIDDENELPMPIKITFDITQHPAWEIIRNSEKNNIPKPRVAILRTQGTNGQVEMARYFMNA